MLGLLLGAWSWRAYRSHHLEQQPLNELASHVARQPEDEEAVLLLARRYLETGQPARAESVLLPFLERTPENSRAWLLRSRAEFDQGKLGEAYATLQLTMPMLDRYAEAHWRLGVLLERRGEEAAAEDAFRRALERDPRHVGAHLEMARSALAHRHYDPALQHLQAVIREEPEHATAHELLSVTYRYLGDLDSAERHARELARIAPDASNSWLALAHVLHDRGTDAAYQEAEEVLERSLRLSQDSFEAHYLLGKIRFTQGNHREAALSLQRSLDLYPLNRQPYPMLIQCLLRLGREEQAERYRREFARVNEIDLSTAPLEYSIYAMPENTALRMQLAELYLKYERPDLALAQVEKILELNPSHPQALKLKEQIKTTSP